MNVWGVFWPSGVFQCCFGSMFLAWPFRRFSFPQAVFPFPFLCAGGGFSSGVLFVFGFPFLAQWVWRLIVFCLDFRVWFFDSAFPLSRFWMSLPYGGFLFGMCVWMFLLFSFHFVLSLFSCSPILYLSLCSFLDITFCYGWYFWGEFSVLSFPFSSFLFPLLPRLSSFWSPNAFPIY